ncbi:hypothetical protein [Catalinimonas niigatensis]|uniref:hypothetical protein n=1 Tax=Catalinimonas niigatensis TaxID=1397264 RepID=UPI00266707A7|nr:hypothetical protein [Catalinimonas niigatensis]WPP53539.1 hypothetical protein PZB72_14285 [Catalinimonas niigatensis]
MKTKIEVINTLEEATLTLNKIKEEMDLMTKQEILSARKIHQFLSKIKGSQNLSASQKKLIPLKEIENAVNEIIVQCQMHDILSQRIEHVIHIQALLTAEISKNNNTWKYGKVLPDVLKLNIWQTTDVQKLWAINTKLIIDDWQLICSSCRILEKILSATSEQGILSQLLRQLSHHCALSANPHYDELFMSAHWQQLDMHYTMLNRKLQKEIISVSANERLNTLRELEKLYTMQAERDILMRLLEANHLLSEEEVMLDTKNSDDLFELF